jgi:hypothetical protein
LRASDNELIKLVETSRTLCPVHFATSNPTYYNPVAREKWSPSSLLLPGSDRSYDTDVDRRVRGTAGGDCLESSVPSSTLVASLSCVNILFNSVVVSSDAFFGRTVDLTDFYLESPLATPQFLKIYTNLYSPEVLSRLSLLPFIKQDKAGKNYITFRIDKTMYGLKEAGKVFNLRLVSILQSFDFHQTHPPGRFRHASTFVLVVDDFCVKYHRPSDFAFLVSCLSTLYHAKAHPIATRLLGFSLNHNRSSRTFSVSYPGYVSTLLTHLRPSGIAHTSSPSIYTPLSYGSTTPQSPTTLDDSPPASPSQVKELQVAVGYLLHYGRAVDAHVLPATCAMASEQASPTIATIARIDSLLGYAAAHPNGQKIFRASEMILSVLSDGFSLSRPSAGSVAGSHHFLGDKDDDAPFNHPIFTHSTRIPVVCSFVAEAEYGTLFATSRIATNERKILRDMGHPQPPTPIFCDNEVAIGLANDSIN